MVKILIVEDNEVNLKLYSYLMKNIPSEVFIAKDGEEALAKAIANEPQIIILDIQIPKISGLDVAKQLRQNPKFKNTKIIAVTAYAMEGDKEKILQAGCDNYISKPLDTRAFTKLLQDLVKTF